MITHLRKELDKLKLHELLDHHKEAYNRGRVDGRYMRPNPYPKDSDDSMAWLLGVEDDEWCQNTDLYQ